MILSFVGKTNGDYPYVNIAWFQSNGEKIIIDRDITEYTIEDDGSITMDWRYCYIWDGEEPDYNIPDDFTSAKFLEIEIEDDAPEGYYLEIEEVFWCL